MNKNNNLADLLKNTSFLQWLKKENGSADASWDKWEQANVKNKQLAEDAKMLERGIPFKKSGQVQANTKKNWNKLLERIEQSPSKHISLHHENTTFNRLGWLKIAASIIFILATFFSFSTYFNQAEQIYHQTNFAENKVIQLADGTLITLAANSSLVYDDDWLDHTNREVQLDGEAYFQVKTQPKGKQFTVKLKDLSITVIGTEFNVNSHREHSIVSLAEGEVTLAKPGIPVKTLLPGQTASFNNEMAAFELQDNQTNYWGDWRFQKWSFGTGMPLQEVIHRIEETFGLTVQVSDQNILGKEASGSINIDNRQVLFESLSYLLEIEFIQRGQKLIISPKLQEQD